jgi:hypothetical protein
MDMSEPFAKAEIESSLRAVDRDIAAFFGSLAPEEFVLREGEAWTPAEHVLHLCKTTNAVARGFGMPRLVLRLRFGRAKSPSRSYAQVRDAYRTTLAAGGKAPAPFVPPPENPTGDDIEGRRTDILGKWARANDRLRGAVSGWNETSLDRIALPHPLLGKLTAREMLLFTLYHDRHHVDAAKRRLPRFAGIGGD